MNRKLVGKCLLTAMLAAGSGNLYAFDDDRDKDNDNDNNRSSDKKFSFALIGDQPYNPVTTGAQSYPAVAYERLIADINKDEKVAFTVHVGDIKAGNTLCADNVYTQNLTYFNTFKQPLIYTPGDNEWTDCHRSNNGGYDPLVRLTFLRSLFYPNNQSLGKKKRTLMRQSDSPGYALYRENAIWVEGPVVFVALNQPGSNNNRGRTTPPFVDVGDVEYTARNAANLAWVDKAFAMAAADSRIRGVVILSQANPFERFLEVTAPPYKESGYADFMAKVRGYVQTSGKQVLYAGGDTHYWRVDKPLTDTYPAPAVLAPAGTRLYNFTRTEVFAQNDVHWTKVSVDKENPNLFTFEARLVPGN